MTDFKAGEKKHRVSLEVITVPESKQSSKNDGDMLKGQRNHMKWLPLGTSESKNK